MKDGILNEPSRCHFNPDTLLCKKGDAHNCLTAPQVAALKKIYAGPHDSTGHQIFPGYTPGGEEGPTGWALWLISGEEPGRALWVANNEPGRSVMSIMGAGYFSHMVYERANWNPKSFDLDRGVKDADAKTGRVLNAIDPNLTAFKARGGKAIIYHGWSDPAIPPLNSVDYYTSVVTKMGLHETDSFLRLFMVPGMQHCEGGPGPDSFGQEGTATPEDPDHHIYMALERWGRSAFHDHRHEICGRLQSGERGKDDAATVPVSSGGEVQGFRQHGRCFEFCLHQGVGRRSSPQGIPLGLRF